MFESLKMDIIYYKTSTDFEMEFNLCGCCRMRLLNDKCSDRKPLINSMAKAVKRSSIIMITGPLFSEDSIINIAAAAINTKLVAIDNAKYNINYSDEIFILKNSTPLVTSEGFFGGCIIESGPQTMILISDNKNIRKQLMTELVHPYIAELVSIGYKQNANVVIEEPKPEETKEEKPQEKEPEVKLVDEVFEPETLEYDIDEPKKKAKKEKKEQKKKNKKKGSALSAFILILAIVILLLIAVLAYFLFYLPSLDGISPTAYIQDIFGELIK